MPHTPCRDSRLVVFDLDGTLVDTSQDLTDALNRALDTNGLPPLTREDVISLVGDGSRKLVDRAVAKVGGPAEMAETVALAFLADYARHVLEKTKPYPGIVQAIERLRREPSLHLALYSNKPTRHVLALLKGLGWDSWFEAVLGGDWGGRKKPAPDGLFHIQKLLGLPELCGVMVGDGTTDQEAGKAAGLATIAVTWGYRPKETLAAHDPTAFCEDSTKLAERILALLDSLET